MPDDNYTLDDIVKVESLTKYVCFRPRLLTATGSVEEVYSFINALILVRHDAETSVAKAAIAWLISHAAFKDGNLSFDSLRTKYGSDANAIGELLRELNKSAPLQQDEG